jgi:hypothetical protein
VGRQDDHVVALAMAASAALDRAREPAFCLSLGSTPTLPDVPAPEDDAAIQAALDALADARAAARAAGRPEDGHAEDAALMEYANALGTATIRAAVRARRAWFPGD